MVPLERNTVRFLDNFSQGTRGAVSAEYFLRHGYAVIFLYRQRTLLPFARQLTLDVAAQTDISAEGDDDGDDGGRFTGGWPLHWLELDEQDDQKVKGGCTLIF